MKHSRLLILLAGLACSPAQADQYTLLWSTTTSGAANATGGSYTLAGSIPQPPVGALAAGGPYSIYSGSWGLFQALPTPGAPLLRIEPVAGGVRVSWPSAATGFILQTSPSLAASNWTSVGLSPSYDGVRWSVVLTPSPGMAFFRLGRP